MRKRKKPKPFNQLTTIPKDEIDLPDPVWISNYWYSTEKERIAATTAIGKLLYG